MLVRCYHREFRNPNVDGLTRWMVASVSTRGPKERVCLHCSRASDADVRGWGLSPLATNGDILWYDTFLGQTIMRPTYLIPRNGYGDAHPVTHIDGP